MMTEHAFCRTVHGTPFQSGHCGDMVSPPTRALEWRAVRGREPCTAVGPTSRGSGSGSGACFVRGDSRHAPSPVPDKARPGQADPSVILIGTVNGERGVPADERERKGMTDYAASAATPGEFTPVFQLQEAGLPAQALGAQEAA